MGDVLFEIFKDRIIVIEGADGTGKDTITNFLHQKIQGTLVVRFPNRDNITGRMIDKILKKEEPFPGGCLFQCLQLANKVETLSDIEKHIVVPPKLFIFCRYIESSLVYGLIDDLPLSFSESINSILPKPLASFVLYGMNYGHDVEYYETDTIQSEVSKTYTILANKYKWNMISNLMSPGEISDIIMGKIQELIKC